MRGTFAVAFAAAVALLGCTEGLRGVPMAPPTAPGRPIATITTKEPGGLRVLWYDRVRGSDLKSGAWIASDPDELDAVWSAAGARGPVPRVDFQNHVVLAVAGRGGLCEPRIVGLHSETTGRLSLLYEHPGVTTCMDLAVRIAKIIAVPRRVLASTVVFLEGFAFQVPPPPFGF